MGGQQSLAMAGLVPNGITAVLAGEPAGGDTNAALHDRQASYPNWPSYDPRIMRTALYFDTVNFTSAIAAPTLVAMGFIDTVVAPAGVWTAFNRIAGPKEALKLIDAGHMDVTPDKVAPYRARIEAVLTEILHTGAYLPKE